MTQDTVITTGALEYRDALPETGGALLGLDLGTQTLSLIHI